MSEHGVPVAVSAVARAEQLGELLWIESASRMPFFGHWTYLYQFGAVFTRGFRRMHPRTSETLKWGCVVAHEYVYDIEVDHQHDIGSVLTRGLSRFEVSSQDGSRRTFSIAEATDRTLASDYALHGRRRDLLPGNLHAQQVAAWIKSQLEASASSKRAPAEPASRSPIAHARAVPIARHRGPSTPRKLLVAFDDSLDGRTRSWLRLYDASCLQRRFEHSGQRSDLARARSIAEEVLNGPHRGLHGEAARRLGVCTMLAAATPSDYTDAVDKLRHALSLLEHDGVDSAEDARLVRIDLGGALRQRYDAMQDLDDLDEAITLARRSVVDETSEDPVHHSRAAWRLGVALQLRYRRSHDPGELDEAIDWLERSAALVSCASDARRTVSLNSLGLALQLRYSGRGDVEDLNRAIAAGQRAIAVARVDDVAIAGMESNLGLAYRLRAERLDASADFDMAVQLARVSVERANAVHTNAACYCFNLAKALYARGDRSRNGSDLSEAMQVAAAVAEAHDAPHSYRFKAAVLLGNVAARYQEWEAAMGGYGAVVDLLEVMVWHGLSRSAKEQLLQSVRMVVASGASAALKIGRQDLAVTLLERGREILWSQQLHLREPVEALRQCSPQLADRFSQLAHELAWMFESENATSLSREQRQQTAVRFDQTVAEIRGQKGFESFLRGPTGSRFKDLATVAPVVLLSTSPYGCDAIVITGKSIQTIPLDGLTEAEVRNTADGHFDNLEALTSARDAQDRQAAESGLGEILQWLRTHVTEPVIDALDRAGLLLDGPQSRVLWCPMGPLALLPIHAAALDRVTSSYISSTRAIAGAHARTYGERLLIVGVPESVGDRRRIDAVATECDKLQARFPEASCVRLGREATRERLMRELPEYAFVHFACHGSQDASNPVASALHLYDGPLSVLDIATRQLRGELAVLSACNTAKGSSELPDEAIHVAAGLQVAGFRHVIATFWAIFDSLAPVVTEAIYRELAPDGTLRTDDVARRLRAAMMELRRKHPSRPSLWSAYGHFGA